MPEIKFVINVGDEFTYLKVTKFLGGRNREFECLCKCGNICKYRGYELGSGIIKSCGCWATDTGHHLTGSPTYRSWRGLRERCDNKTHHNYHIYGARGITYDPRWSKFKEFLSDMGVRPKGTTLDRKDTNGNYCKDNCKWSTNEEQCNNRRDNVVLEFNGERLTLMQWAKRYNMKWATLDSRLKRKWSIEDALTKPVNHSCSGTHSRRPK